MKWTAMVLVTVGHLGAWGCAEPDGCMGDACSDSEDLGCSNGCSNGASETPDGSEDPPGVGGEGGIEDPAVVGSSVETLYGWLHGEEKGGAFVFKGIPYAKAPVGERRWASPETPDAWGEKTAAAYGSDCPQKQSEEQDEDCLFLNIWTQTELTTASKLPVMVWIHGGGHETGSGRFGAAHRFVQDGVVFVTLNYRLGYLGYLAHPALKSEGPLHTTGNYGTQDVVAALEFVHDNIQRFGGDPDRVTVFGQSAGGGETCAMMMTPLADGLFHRGIQHSGACPGIPQSWRIANQGIPFAQAHGCEGENEIACFRSLAVEDILNTPRFVGEVPFLPGIDGIVLPDSINKMLAAGTLNDVDYIFGGTAQENFVSGVPAIDTKAQLETALAARFPTVEDMSEEIENFLLHYPLELHGSYAGIYMDVITDRAMTCMNRRLSESLSDTTDKNVFLFYFSHVLTAAPWAAAKNSFHSLDIRVLFGQFLAGYEPDDSDLFLADAMMAYWTEFAATGNPGPDWPAVDTVPGKIAGQELHGEWIGTHDDLKAAQCDYLASL